MTILYVSTRGYYDLSSGKIIKKKKYHFSSKNFQKLDGKKEVTIIIHGLRNNRNSAQKKFLIVKNRLRKLGYEYPVLGFSYDSNVKGAHIKKYEKRTITIGHKIAKMNGVNLGKFILDLKKICPLIKIRLIGHSLGSEVITHTIFYLTKFNHTQNIIESVYFFGSSISAMTFSKRKNIHDFQKIIKKKIVNYYSKSDDVLVESVCSGMLTNPIGISRIRIMMNNFIQKKVKPLNHRFASYATTLESYP